MFFAYQWIHKGTLKPTSPGQQGDSYGGEGKRVSMRDCSEDISSVWSMYAEGWQETGVPGGNLGSWRAWTKGQGLGRVPITLALAFSLSHWGWDGRRQSCNVLTLHLSWCVGKGAMGSFLVQPPLWISRKDKGWVFWKSLSISRSVSDKQNSFLWKT